MVTRGRIRGNGSQLASYLLKKGDNDNVEVFHIQGTSHPENLKRSLLEMSLTSELTKSDKGLYHVQLCPAYGEDKKMTSADWLKAAEILEQETCYTGQKRAIVLHEKKGRIHAHVVWERYDHERQIMIPDSFSRLAQDRARIKIEQELKQQRTPIRNERKDEIKKCLSSLWQQTDNAKDFIDSAFRQGFIMCAGTQRPYMVVDEHGRSFDLVRQLTGVKTKEVQKRFSATKLIREKQAIENVRAKQRQEVQSKSFSKVNVVYKEKEKTPSSNDNRKAPYKLEVSFSVSEQDSKNKDPQQTIDLKEKEKQRLLNKIKQEKLRRAREYRENERDL